MNLEHEALKGLERRIGALRTDMDMAVSALADRVRALEGRMNGGPDRPVSGTLERQIEQNGARITLLAEHLNGLQKDQADAETELEKRISATQDHLAQVEARVDGLETFAPGERILTLEAFQADLQAKAKTLKGRLDGQMVQIVKLQAGADAETKAHLNLSASFTALGKELHELKGEHQSTIQDLSGVIDQIANLEKRVNIEAMEQEREEALDEARKTAMEGWAESMAQDKVQEAEKAPGLIHELPEADFQALRDFVTEFGEHASPNYPPTLWEAYYKAYAVVTRRQG